jgi:predicted nuclease of predicted toxin-antitoxin system
LKLLLDLNLSPLWVAAFEALGYEAAHWSRIGDPGASDRDILEWGAK